MPEIVLEGSPETLLVAMSHIKRVTATRKADGWSLFQSDEKWEYRTQGDERVCPKCEEFGSQTVFSGPSVGFEFPDKRRLSDESGGLFHPEVHITYPEWRGRCRCRVEFQNISETLVFRLDLELKTIVINVIGFTV